MNQKNLQRCQITLTLTATMYKGAGNNGMTLVPLETYNTPKQVGVAADINGHDSLKRVYSENGKSPTVNAHGGGNTEPKVAVTSYREVRTEKAKEISEKTLFLSKQGNLMVQHLRKVHQTSTF